MLGFVAMIFLVWIITLLSVKSRSNLDNNSTYSSNTNQFRHQVRGTIQNYPRQNPNNFTNNYQRVQRTTYFSGQPNYNKYFIYHNKLAE